MAKAEVSREEEQKRAAVFTKYPRTILVKILAMGALRGIRRLDRDNTAIRIKHALEAGQRGLNATAYGEKREDTGYCLFEKEAGVRVDNFLVQLHQAGYRLVEIFWQEQNGKGPVTTCKYEKEGREIEMPDAVKEIFLQRRFNNGTVWCNLKHGDDGKQFRLDTINLAKGRVTDEPSRQLSIEGNTYRLI